MEGWIKLHRNITNHWIWQDPVKLKWWLDVIMFANHEDKKVNIGMQLVDCKRGQCVMSLLNWGKRWGVSKNTARNFFTLLKNDGMIASENLTKTTRITICNYDNYQDGLHAVETVRKRNGNAVETQRDTNKNVKNEKNIINDVYSFDDFWNDYDKKVGSKPKLVKKWDKIPDNDKLKIKDHIPRYKSAQTDKQFRKNPETYINQESWNDEIIKSKGKNNETTNQENNRYGLL